MRRRAVATAARLLTSARARAPSEFVSSCCPNAGRIGVASTSSPSVTAAARLLSISARGLACPPHGGSGGGNRSGSGSVAAATSEHNHHDPAAEAAYHAAADDALHALLDGLEAWVDDTPGLADVDVEYSSGVLTLSLGVGRGTYVLNKQAPNRQLWLSSPVSGPLRYDHVNGKWLYARDGSELGERLRKELAQLTGVDPPEI